jgi:hypothetical protein
MAAELLRASEAARRLGVPMVDGIAHVPDDAFEEYRAKAS